MNDRIRVIAIQTDVWCDQNHAGDDHYDIMWEQKFAELIVEECRYVLDCNKGGDQHTEWNRALFETSEKIQEYFGVDL
jgi:hypothetical protein